MANKGIFQSYRGTRIRAGDAINEAGGTAYRLTDTHALAQYAATGCLNGTFYAAGENQLAKVLRLCDRVPPEFIARAAKRAPPAPGNAKKVSPNAVRDYI
jgi:60 kDa SS-A/Ro ribonucleoprotein